MRKVLFVEINEDGTVGGSHQCLHDIVRGLDRSRYAPSVVFYEDNRFVAPVRASGAEVVVWNRESERRHKRYRGWRARVVLAWGAVEAITSRVSFLRRGGFDVVHLNNSPCIGFEDWLPAARIVGIPIIAHARGPYFGPGSALGRAATRRFDRVIAISRHIAENMAAHGIPAAALRTIHDGIDVRSWRARATGGARVRGEIGVAPDRILVAMVGQLRPWKGQDVVLRALARVAAVARERLTVAFVGEATRGEEPYAEALRETITRERLDGCVRFLGWRADVPDVMDAADVVLHASTLAEPFGLVVLEGMALGKIVVATRLGGPLETVADGTGVLFDPADPGELAAILETIVGQPWSFEAMREAGRRHAETFDVSENVRKIQAVYDELF